MAKNNKKTFNYTTKKCYECFTHLTLDAEECYACKSKVGKVGRNGIAQKPFDWKGYTVCILLWIVFAIYIWKAFF